MSSNTLLWQPLTFSQNLLETNQHNFQNNVGAGYSQLKHQRMGTENKTEVKSVCEAQENQTELLHPKVTPSCSYFLDI